jgi:hypothetical protein
MLDVARLAVRARSTPFNSRAPLEAPARAVVEGCMREVILAVDPDVGILGEELGGGIRRGGRGWTLDPLDDRDNLRAGSPLWGAGGLRG